jgi:hypothetical protein
MASANRDLIQAACLTSEERAFIGQILGGIRLSGDRKSLQKALGLIDSINRKLGEMEEESLQAGDS